MEKQFFFFDLKSIGLRVSFSFANQKLFRNYYNLNDVIFGFFCHRTEQIFDLMV